MRKFLGALVVVSMSVGLCGFSSVARDPLGETADYKVDRNSSRTTSMIQSGTMNASVDSYDPDNADGASYAVKIDYTLKIQFMGTRSGTEMVTVPEEYFTPEFMEDLRANGSYSSESFKVEHLGYADVRTMDGGVYPNCDKVRIYDIDTSKGGKFVDFAKMLLASGQQHFDGDFEDMEIIGHIKEGLPVLGAAKIDVSGIYQGMRVKAGADYQRP